MHCALSLRICKNNRIFAEQMKTRIYNHKEQVFCEWRRQYVRLTPEEWVRQNFLHRLVNDYHCPMSLIGVEVCIAVGETQKRCDAVVYTRQMTPRVLLEFKAETVPLTQKVLDQAITYNRTLQVPFLILHNGGQTVVAHITENEVQYLDHIPEWSEISLPTA